MQVARPFAVVGHAIPQPLQCIGSAVTSTHAPLHNVLVAPEHPVAHAYEDPAALHIGAAAVHVVAHAPQCAGSEMSVSQPSAAPPTQSA